MRLSHVTQGTTGAQVAHRTTRRMAQYIVGHCHQGIFLIEHLSVLADNGQPIHIRIHYKAHVCLGMLHQVGNLRQILRYRLRIMRKSTMRRTMQLEYLLHTQRMKQLWNNTATYRVHTVYCYTEMSSLNRLHIYQT